MAGRRKVLAGGLAVAVGIACRVRWRRCHGCGGAAFARRWAADASRAPPSGAERLRNVGIIAHVDAGKTTTTERMLFYSGVVRSMGDVDSGSTVTDFLRDERERGITIQSAAVSLPWRAHQLNLIDTPGHVDFGVEVQRALHVMDGAVAIVDAVAGVQAQTEAVWRQADARRLPRVVYVNKLDREGASLRHAVRSLHDRLGVAPLLIQLPVVGGAGGGSGAPAGASLDAVLDLPSRTATVYRSDDRHGLAPEVRRWEELGDAALLRRAEEARESLVEAVAEFDEPVLERYVEGHALDDACLRGALRRVSLQRRAFVVTCGASLRNRGVQQLLDAIVDFLPSPLETEPVYSTGAHDKREVVPPSPSFAATAMAFKVSHDRHLGALVFFRVYSGSFVPRVALYNATQAKKELPQRLLKVFADRVEDVAEATIGGVYCATGLKLTKTGDTLTVASQQYTKQLDGIAAPAPVFFAAVEAESKMDEDRLNAALQTMLREDPSLSCTTSADTGQLLVGGMGELHLDILRQRLHRDHKVDFRMGTPRVAYREAIQSSTTITHRHDQTIGGHRLVASMSVRVRPNADGVGNACSAEAIARLARASSAKGQLSADDHGKIEAILDGLRSALNDGPTLGLPLADTVVEALDVGSDRLAEQSANALQACAASAVREALRTARTGVVEPLMRVEITAAQKHTSDVISDLHRRRGEVESVEASAASSAAEPLSAGSSALRTWVIVAHVPLQGLLGYATSLRSQTGGTAAFTMRFVRYAPPSEAHEPEVLRAARGY